MSEKTSPDPESEMKEVGFGKLTCSCGYVNWIVMDKPWAVDKPLRCENCGRIIVQKERNPIKKWGDRIAGVLSRHLRPRTA